MKNHSLMMQDDLEKLDEKNSWMKVDINNIIIK
jgi:hypothetical protein